MTPFNAACGNGHLEVAKWLLEHNADISITDIDGWTPLHAAAGTGQLEIINLLLGKFADFGATTKLSETSLHIASRRDSPELVASLLAHGCSPLQLDDYGRTCLDWAFMYQPCYMAMNNWANGYTPTPETTSNKILKKTIIRLLDEALSENMKTSLYSLGHCLLFIGNESNAYRAFEQNISITTSGVQHSAYCSRCPSQDLIYGNCYVCKSCTDIYLCQPCFENFHSDKKPWRCQSHDFIQVPRDGYVITEETEDTRWECMQDWLREIKTQYSRD